jgi:hypothetical protein
VFYLKIIINAYGKHATPMIKKKFLADFEKMYSDPKFETDFQSFDVLMQLHEYGEEYMMRIADDAAYRWSDNRFQSLVSNFDIAFSEMGRRSPEIYHKFFKWLDAKMQDAERSNEEKARQRLETLRKSAARFTY